MSNNSSSLFHEFKVQSILSKTRNIDCSLNITKRREQIFYSSSLATETVGIAFASNDPLTSDTNISIVDRSTSLIGNRIQEVDYTVLDAISSFNIETDSFVVTDIFVVEENTISPEPLFYQHVISLEQIPRTDPDNYDFSLDTNYRLISVELLDNAYQPIKLTEKYIDLDTGIIYSNIQTEYNSTIDYTIHYVRYTFTNGTVVKTLVELLDNKPVFRIATFDDLDYALQIINDGRKVYLLEDLTTYFQVTLPQVATYAFKPLVKSRIKVLPPVSSDSDDSWFVRVSNGKFFQNLNGVLHKYYISEFLTQTFNPVEPLKRIQLEDSTILGKSLIKLDRENIIEDEDLSLFVQIEINKSDGTGVAAFSTDPSEEGNIALNGQPYVRWSNTNRQGIRSIDHSTGIVDIEGLDLKSTWTIESNYYFEETNYEFTLYNFNPIGNNDALKHNFVLFLDPETGIEKDQTLYYLKVDESGKVVESNWDQFDNINQVYDSDNQELYYESFPDYLPVTGHHIFVDEFSVEGYTITSGINTTNFLILGDIATAEAQHVTETTEVDSRKRGGGIKASEIEELISSNIAPEVQWCWDEGYWDGIPYPGNASFLIEVPVDILNNINEGKFNQAQIRDIVSRHTAAGIYPVIRAYGVDVQVTGIIPTSEGLILNWYSNGFGY